MGNSFSIGTTDFWSLLGIISDQWMDQFTLKIYHQLIALMGSLQSIELQQQLFEALLMNFSLLIQLEGPLQLRILKLWPRSLFPTFLAIAKDLATLETLLGALRVFYWYAPVERTYIVAKESRTDSFPVAGCRAQLLESIYSLLSDSRWMTWFRLWVIALDAKISRKLRNYFTF
jgi:hypothetical protein